MNRFEAVLAAALQSLVIVIVLVYHIGLIRPRLLRRSFAHAWRHPQRGPRLTLIRS